MNHNAILSVLVFLLCFYHYCFGSIGCMDKSWHTKKSYDYKNLHYAASTVDPKDPQATHCLCPCENYIAQHGKQVHRGRCPVCKHYRIPQPVIVVNNALQQYKQYQQHHESKEENKHEIKSTRTPQKNIKNVIALWHQLTAHPKSVTLR